MLTIDADAHVIETEKTWEYLEGGDRRFRPVAISVDMPSGKRRNFWIIDGQLIGGRDNGRSRIFCAAVNCSSPARRMMTCRTCLNTPARIVS